MLASRAPHSTEPEHCVEQRTTWHRTRDMQASKAPHVTGLVHADSRVPHGTGPGHARQQGTTRNRQEHAGQHGTTHHRAKTRRSTRDHTTHDQGHAGQQVTMQHMTKDMEASRHHTSQGQEMKASRAPNGTGQGI